MKKRWREKMKRKEDGVSISKVWYVRRMRETVIYCLDKGRVVSVKIEEYKEGN